MKVICFLISMIYFVKTNQILLFIGKSYYFKKYYLRWEFFTINNFR